MQTEIDSKKDVGISTVTGKSFDLLKLLKPYFNANGDICMYLTLYERKVAQMEIDK